MGLFGRSPAQPDPEFDGQPVLLRARAESHSRPGRVVSGNGTLSLTATELVFEQRLPHGILRIPRASITGVSAKRPFNMRFAARLLEVVWRTDSGAEDSLVITVKDPDGWLEALGYQTDSAP